ncbi:MAG: YqaE/Pmp3 family membrane protein [Hormoscilla sp. GM7CHS1pb]|nr:YqaE/Pmp3 family membrane protein [Hormoscilla sp. GM7CHS1pb]
MGDLIRILCAIFLPPWEYSYKLVLARINILLTRLGYLPGIIHAVWVIARK